MVVDAEVSRSALLSSSVSPLIANLAKKDKTQVLTFQTSGEERGSAVEKNFGIQSSLVLVSIDYWHSI